MAYKNKWGDISLLGICTVALSGFVLRSKIVFALPMVNYNNLLEGHSHFAFGGWVTIALASFMVKELLPAPLNTKTVYQWILGVMAISAWCTLIAFIAEGYGILSIITSTIFICFTYIFAIAFIKDIIKQKLPKTVLVLAISSLICLVVSSAGSFVNAKIFISKSFDAILYRDALFTYLHFQYNGFFSLAIFAILCNQSCINVGAATNRNIFRFSIALSASIIPSLFLSYLWQDPNQWFRIIAIIGCLLLLVSLFFLLISIRTLLLFYSNEKLIVRLLVLLSICSFLLKLFMQSFTILPQIGNAIFGNRPIIMGFLHLVFLGFISPFIFAHLTQKGFLNGTRLFTRIALMAFAMGVVCNEVLLISQGLASMFVPGNNNFPWLLWFTGILLFTSTVLIAIARIQTKRQE